MAGMRRVRTGGMMTDAGASGRTDSGSNLLRPAYSYQGVITPGEGGAGAGHAVFLDLSNVASWRLIFVGAALAYIVGFHVSLGRLKLNVSRG